MLKGDDYGCNIKSLLDYTNPEYGGHLATGIFDFFFEL